MCKEKVREGVKIKICGLRREEDIAFANEARPDFCGFIINVPKSIRNTTPEQVRELRKNLSPEIVPVGVFRDEPIETVVSLLRDGTIAAVQLHGHEDEEYIRTLKSRGDFTVVKAFNENTMGQAQACSADYVLLDHGSGGTGEAFHWELAEMIHRPYFLAGGLNRKNILQAIEALHPWAVDVSSGVETEGKKDKDKMIEIVQMVRSLEG